VLALEFSNIHIFYSILDIGAWPGDASTPTRPIADASVSSALGCAEIGEIFQSNNSILMNIQLFGLSCFGPAISIFYVGFV